MAVLTSEYQYLGRSSGMTAKSGYATYYLLLFGKAVPNNNTGIYKVSIKFYMASDKNSTFYWYSTNYNGKINNTQVFGSTTDKEPRDEWELSSFKAGDVTYNKATFIKEGSLEIDCSNGLSKDIPLSAYWKIVDDDGDTYVPASGTNRTVSVTATLPAIPRATTLDSFSGSKRIGVSNDVIINFTKKNNAFTTTLEYATKNDFSDAVTIVNKISNASTYPWTIPISLLNKIPNSKTLPIYIRLTTYNGDTQIGTAQTSSFTANVYSENCKPIWNTHTIEETDTTAKKLVTTANKFIANLSKPKFTFSATGQYGATIKYYQINNVTRSSGFTDSAFNTNGYTLKVVDSRGIENTYKFNLTYVPYFTPVFEEVKLFRDVPTSNKVLSYFKIKFFNNTSSVKFDNPQALSYKFNYQETGGTTQEVSITPTTSDSEASRTAENETELGTTFNYKKSIDWTFFFVDLTGKTFKTGNTLPMGVPLMNGKMNSEGEQELFVNGKATFNESVNIIKDSTGTKGIKFGDDVVLRQATSGVTVISSQNNAMSFRPNGNNNVNGGMTLNTDGTLDIALIKNIRQISGEGRVTSANVGHNYTEGFVSEKLNIASSAMTTGKPAGDGYIKTFIWDNSGAYDVQLFIHNNATSLPPIQYRQKLNSSWGAWHIVHPYKIGDVVITSTNVGATEMANRYGGTWELIDKEFTPIHNQSGGATLYSTNTTSMSSNFTRSGHTILFTTTLVNKVNFGTSNLQIFTMALSTLGVTNLGSVIRTIGWTEDGDCASFIAVDNSNGIARHYHTIPDSYISAGRNLYYTFSFTIPHTCMLDSACNKFYWKRTA